MNSRRLSPLFVLLVLVAVGAYWLVTRQGEAGAGALVTPNEPALAARRVAEDLPEIPSASSDRFAVVAQPVAPVAETARVELFARVVLLAARSPVAGVTVTAYAVSMEGYRSSYATTDTDGMCSFDWDAPVMVNSFVVGAGRETAGARQSEALQLLRGANGVVELVVHGGGTLRGRVVDASGTPISGAEVVAWCEESFRPAHAPNRSATSDRDGAFALEHIGAAFLAIARKDGFVCSSGLRGTLAADAQADGLELTLVPARALRGVVVDEADRPLADVELSVHADGQSSSSDATAVPDVRRFFPIHLDARSDAFGRFALAPIPDHSWNVRVVKPDRPFVDATVSPAAEARIVLPAGVRLTGRVLRWDGQPVANAKVEARDGFAARRASFSDAHGRFEIGGLTATEEGSVAVLADGYALFLLQPLVIGPGESDELVLRLERALPLAGRVVDTAGQPIEGARVRIYGGRILDTGTTEMEPNTLERLLGQHEQRTDVRGAFRYPNLYDGRFEVRVSPPDAPDLVEVGAARSGREDLEIVIDRKRAERAVFVGRVTDGVTRAPIREFVVTPMQANGTEGMRGRNRAMRDPDGRFRVVGLEPIASTLCVQAEGYARWESAQFVAELGEQTIEVVLYPKRALALSVRWSKDRPVNQTVTATFFDAQGNSLQIDVGVGGSTSTAFLGEGRTTTVQGLPASFVRVHIEATGVEPIVRDLDLTRPLADTIVFELDYRAPVVEQHPFALLVFGTSDRALLELEEDELSAPFREGKFSELREKVELELFDAQDRSIAKATLEPAGEGHTNVTLTWDSWAMTWDQKGMPFVRGELPAAPRRVRATCVGYEPRTLALPETMTKEDVVTLLLLRTAPR